MGTFLRHVKLVYTREVGALLSMPLYYVLAGVFFTLTALIYLSTLIEFAQTESQEAANVTASVVVPMFQAVHYFLLVQIPLLTMRVFAEDRSNGMLDLLRTTPLGDWALLTGKFLANATAIGGYVILTLIFPLTTAWVSTVEWPVIMGSSLALLLAAAGYTAIGMLFSAMTESQVVAAVLSYVALFSFVFVSFFIDVANITALSDAARHFSVLEHMEGLLSGNIAIMNVCYFVLMIFAGLFLTARLLEARKWIS